MTALKLTVLPDAGGPHLIIKFGLEFPIGVETAGVLDQSLVRAFSLIIETERRKLRFELGTVPLWRTRAAMGIYITQHFNRSARASLHSLASPLQNQQELGVWSGSSTITAHWARSGSRLRAILSRFTILFGLAGFVGAPGGADVTSSPSSICSIISAH